MTPSGTVVYHYDLAGNLISETDSGGTPIRDYVWHDATPIAQIDSGPTETVVFIHTDHLATPRLATNTVGLAIWRWEGAAFGDTPPNEDVDGDGQSTTVNLRFPGQYFDGETGRHYNSNRYYDAATGRYVRSDPVGLHAGLNSYSYVLGNPLIASDPSGLYTSARWLSGPSLGGITRRKIGDIGFGEYWTLIPPSIGIGGTWWMLNAEIVGKVECLDEQCGSQKRDVFDIKVELGKRVGIGYGITTFPRLQAIRRTAGAFSTIADAIEFYRKEWTQRALDMARNPLAWCFVIDTMND